MADEGFPTKCTMASCGFGTDRQDRTCNDGRIELDYTFYIAGFFM